MAASAEGDRREASGARAQRIKVGANGTADQLNVIGAKKTDVIQAASRHAKVAMTMAVALPFGSEPVSMAMASAPTPAPARICQRTCPSRLPGSPDTRFSDEVTKRCPTAR